VSQTAATSAAGADPAAASGKGPPVPQCSSFIRGGAATPVAHSGGKCEGTTAVCILARLICRLA
jgi:hypothetical protein